MIIEKPKVQETIRYLSIHYVYYNVFAVLFTLYQYERIPIAIPIGAGIFMQIILLYYFTKRTTIRLLDRTLFILAYNYILILYYAEIDYYVFGNIFLLISFCIRTRESCTTQIDHEYGSILRFLKTFYRFSILVASICISLKLNNYVEWTWPQSFWWYWMFISALVGTCFTIIIVLISKIINEYIKYNKTATNEYKTILWAFYISLMSSLICGIWITNTFNLLGVQMPLNIGEILFYSVSAFNIIGFILLTKLLQDSICDFCLGLISMQPIEQDIQRGTSIQQLQLTCQKQIEKKSIQKSILLKKLSSAFFRQTTKLDDLTNNKDVELFTERGQNKNILNEQDNQTQIAENNKCIICCDNQPNAVIMPCGHGGICYKCTIDLLQKNKECFLCRKQIILVYEISCLSKDIMKVISITRINQ